MGTKRDLFERRNDMTSDEFKVTLTDGHALFFIDEPWSGSTVDGFGKECSFTLERDDAVDLAYAILKFYDIAM